MTDGHGVHGTLPAAARQPERVSCVAGVTHTAWPRRPFTVSLTSPGKEPDVLLTSHPAFCLLLRAALLRSSPRQDRPCSGRKPRTFPWRVR